MGGVCCSNDDAAKAFALVQRLGPLSKLNLRDVINEGTSIAIIGQKAVGKTLLFLRLIYPEFDTTDMTSLTSETETLHVELLNFLDQSILLWDISGGLLECGVLRHLNSLHLPGLIYVISMLDTSPPAITKYRRDLALLVSHPLAMVRKVLIIFNTFGAFDEESPVGRARTNVFIRGLDLNKLISIVGPSQMSFVVGNVKEGLQDNAIFSALQTFVLKLYS